MRDTVFSYVGLTNRVSTERHEDWGMGALLRMKAYGYDAAGQRASLVYTPAGGTPEVYSYLHDPHGNVSLLLAASAVKGSYGYTRYGSTDAALTKGDASPDNPLNVYRYTGHRYDTGSGTLDMGARRYSRSWGGSCSATGSTRRGRTFRDSPLRSERTCRRCPPGPGIGPCQFRPYSGWMSGRRTCRPRISPSSKRSPEYTGSSCSIATPPS